MIQDVAERLRVLGFKAISDFNAVDEGGGNVRVDWLSAQPMPSEAEINAVDMSPAAVAARTLAKLYIDAKALLTADDPISKKEKAFVMVVLDEFNARATHINVISARVNAIAAAIVSGGTYAAMRTAVGNPTALTNYQQRTVAQLKTSIGNKIDAGQADG